MARFFSQTLFRHTLRSQSSVFGLANRRYCSSGKAKIIEIDLSESSSTSLCSNSTLEGGEVVNKLEELMHRLLVQRSTPDWLPFVPGSSFWVPPTRRYTGNSRGGGPVVPLLDYLHLPHLLSEDEQLSLSSSRGWPSSAYFITGSAETPRTEEVREAEAEAEAEKVVVVELPDPNEDG